MPRKQIAAYLTEELIEWIDLERETVNVSRSDYISRALTDWRRSHHNGPTLESNGTALEVRDMSAVLEAIETLSGQVAALQPAEPEKVSLWDRVKSHWKS